MTQPEVTYGWAGTSTNLATFTTEDNLMKTCPPVFIPAGFFGFSGQPGKCLKVKAYGQIGFTTGSPTFQWMVRLVTAASPPAWAIGGLLLGQTAAVATGAVAVVTTRWTLDLDVVCTVVGTGAATTVRSDGEVRAPAALASPFSATIPSLAVTDALTTVDNSQPYYLYLSAACGTSNSLNLINTTMLKCYGEN
jgi:hypothetical protein